MQVIPHLIWGIRQSLQKFWKKLLNLAKYLQQIIMYLYFKIVYKLLMNAA